MAIERVHFWNELHGLAQGHEKRWLLHQWRKDIWDSLIPPYLLCVLCINDQPVSPATKNPTAFPRKVKIAPTTLPTIAGKASTAFPACLLSASANLSNHFHQDPFVFWWGTSCLSTYPSKNTYNRKDNRWNSHWKGSQYWKYSYPMYTK